MWPLLSAFTTKPSRTTKRLAVYFPLNELARMLRPNHGSLARTAHSRGRYFHHRLSIFRADHYAFVFDQEIGACTASSLFGRESRGLLHHLNRASTSSWFIEAPNPSSSSTQRHPIGEQALLDVPCEDDRSEVELELCLSPCPKHRQC